MNKRLVLDKEDIMVFDLARYIDEPLVYFDNNKKIDDQKMFLLGVKIRSDIVDLLVSGVKAKDITVRKLDPSEDGSYALINMVADSVLSDWGIELAGPSDAGEDVQYGDIETGDVKLLKKTITNFKISDSKNREGAVIRAVKEDLDAISDQLNNELNAFPQPMREMIMMTIVDRLHSWEESNWEENNWD
ncbi:MAG: hypothetical protein E7383_11270 [Ruminococcaceae bacterium]|nr:hypothetical protein [Oscillospiraceae bacterium]MBR2599108.1 hypothetical protein [Clostridiales bacterium]